MDSATTGSVRKPTPLSRSRVGIPYSTAAVVPRVSPSSPYDPMIKGRGRRGAPDRAGVVGVRGRSK
jgi:hypothetical protein